MKTSDLFVKALENEGISYIFGVPGEENIDFLESLRKSKKIKFITTRHEQAAGFMAATVGRLTGKAGVAISTLGPGATNLLTAAAYGKLGGMPMVIITGQKPIKESKQGHFQIIETSKIMNPVTKLTKTIVSGNKTPSLVREAFRRAEEERPGTVHLELPEDIAREKVTREDIFEAGKPRRPIAEKKAISQAVEMIKKAKHPLLLVGAAANRKNTSKMLREFIDKTGIPFFNTQMGKGVIDERSPLFLGTSALSANDFVHCSIKKADLIINVGHDVIEKPPFIMERGKTKVIHINFFSAEVDDVYFPQLEVVGDIANAIWQIKEALEKQESWDFSYFMRIKESLEKHLEEKSNDPSFPILPQRITTDTRKVLRDTDIVALDNGMYKIWFSRNYKTYRPNTLLLDNALATMGAGLPSGIAAKLLYPEKNVVVISGDGGFMMNSQEIETAIRLKLDLVAVIVNDNGYGMIKWKQESQGLPPFGLDYKNPDFKKYSESYGAKGHKIKSADEYGVVLQEALKEGGVHIIEVPVDYSENIRVLNKELKELTCKL